MKSYGMRLGRLIGVIPCNDYIIVRDYLNGFIYANGTVEYVLHKVLDYNMELRQSVIYGISSIDKNVIVFSVLLPEWEG